MPDDRLIVALDVPNAVEPGSRSPTGWATR
jgi:hypothetical protein